MPWTRDDMARRAAAELKDGFYVNLGIGIPTLVSNFIPPGITVQLQSENGMMGMGPFPFEGEEKLLHRCTLPLTGAAVVDVVITDLAVFTIDKKGGGMELIEIAPDVTLDDVKRQTEAAFRVRQGVG